MDFFSKILVIPSRTSLRSVSALAPDPNPRISDREGYAGKGYARRGYAGRTTGWEGVRWEVDGWGWWRIR